MFNQLLYRKPLER